MRCELCRHWYGLVANGLDRRCHRPAGVLEMIPTPGWFGCVQFEQRADLRAAAAVVA